MSTLGITGGLASGKSTVAQAFAELGAEVINADQVAHQLMVNGGSCVDAIESEFGHEVVQDGAVNRRALAGIVFSDADRLKKLESIIHPVVRRVMEEKIDAIHQVNPKALIVLDVPLLFEAKMQDLVEVIIVVRCDQAQQVQRAAESLKIAKQDALLRIQSQMPLDEKAQRADIVIDNTGSKQELINEVKLIWQKVQPIQGR